MYILKTSLLEIAFVYDPDGYWVEIIQRDGFRLARNAEEAS